MRRCKTRAGKKIGAGGALLILVLLGAATPAAAGEAWPPITAEEKGLSDDTLRRGAPAVVLFRSTFTDYRKHEETSHIRIKILTEQGKRYADVELPYWSQFVQVEDLEARTVRPNGQVVPFMGQVYEKTLVKTRRARILAKTLTLPEVEVGSIIEWRYRLKWNPDKMGNFAPPWRIQGELSLLKGRFTVKPPESGWGYTLRWRSYKLPQGSSFRSEKDLEVLEVKDVPGLSEEEYAPPDEMVRVWVKFYYEFWRFGPKEMSDYVETFIGKPKWVEREVARLISPGDAPEAKLRKLYERTHPMRRIGGRTEQEQKRAKLKENMNVKEVLERRYGTPSDWNRVFVALARAAGFEAAVVRVGSRNGEMYNPQTRDYSQLNAELVVVRNGDKDLYLNPGAAFTPFGMLPWEQTGARGLKLIKDGGANIMTPQPVSTEAVTRRVATLRLEADGSLQGKVQLTFRGREALTRRQDAQEKDEIELRKELEEELKADLSAGTAVTLEKVGSWESSEEPLEAEFSIKASDFALTTGRRLLVPLGIFHAQGKHPFEHQERTQPVYFSYPWEEEDEITLEVPDGYSVEGLPEVQTTPVGFGRYEIAAQKEENRLRIKRRLVMEGYYFRPNHYLALREFYSRVRTGDGQHAILQAATVADEAR